MHFPLSVEGLMGQAAVLERPFWHPWGRVDQKWQDWWLEKS